MCGFVCVYDPEALLIPPAALHRMTETLQHRGPDDFGYAASGPDGIRTWQVTPPSGLPTPGVAFGHRRLRILDLSDAGRQPFNSPSHRYWMVYNGELYNYIELRNELKQFGHCFRTETDTEVVLAAFEQWGPDCLARFNGMWALAIWDDLERSLFVARDRIGIKPLFYARTGTAWVFASEIKALLQHPLIRAEPDAEKLLRFLHYDEVPSPPSTFFQGIQTLEPATSMRLTSDKVSTQRYWNIPEAAARLPADPAARASKLRFLIMDSVELQLRADVPIGTMLSGGLDSTTIALGINQHLGTEKASTLQKAVSAFYPGSWNDESQKVNQLASHLGIEVHPVYPMTADISQTIGDVIFAVEAPFSGTMPIVQDLMMREAGALGLRVVLNGHGPDEMLAGYPARHCSFAALGLLMQLQLTAFTREVAGMRKLHAVPTSDLLYTLIRNFSPSMAAAAAGHLKRHTDIFFDRDWLRLAKASPAKSLDRQYPGKTPLARRLRAEFDHEIVPRYLDYEDRVSMRSSVESRVPFLDHRIIEYAFSLPDSDKIKDGVTKRILRSAMNDRLPSEIVDDNQKVYIESPFQRWLGGCLREFANDMIGHNDMRIGALLNTKEVNDLASRATSNGACSRHELSLVWRLMITEGWARRFTESRL